MSKEVWLANYIVNFLLEISGWYIMGDCLVCNEKELNDGKLKNGFTLHTWTLCYELRKEVFYAKLKQLKQLNTK